jgi:hypothetical protein
MSGYPETPDGRYFVVEGRLWRRANPALEPEVKDKLTRRLMRARRAVLEGLRTNDQALVREARRRIGQLKVALGERGAPWWDDGAPDYNKKLVGKTPYADWYSRIARETRETQLFWPGNEPAESTAG